MAKKKTNKKKLDKTETHDSPKTWAEIENAMYNEDSQEYSWSESNLDQICDYLQKLGCHMVWTGLEMVGQPEEDRMRVLNEIMETKRYQLSEEEMKEQLPFDVIKEQLLKFSKEIEPGVYSVNDIQFGELCNKLAELGVYSVMRDLEKRGYLTLAWDADKNDFVYKPGPKMNEGDDWKNSIS